MYLLSRLFLLLILSLSLTEGKTKGFKGKIDLSGEKEPAVISPYYPLYHSKQNNFGSIKKENTLPITGETAKERYLELKEKTANPN